MAISCTYVTSNALRNSNYARNRHIIRPLFGVGVGVCAGVCVGDERRSIPPLGFAMLLAEFPHRRFPWLLGCSGRSIVIVTLRGWNCF